VSSRRELIAVEGVTKRYLTSSGSVEALHDVSLSVDEGAFCTLIGPSGCGKSTLLSMLGGLVAPDQGRLLVEGQPVSGPDPRRDRLPGSGPVSLADRAPERRVRPRAAGRPG
jgi:ABC-type Fe3+/spermidine/putrescine transport system ATPase subunit